MLKGKPKILRGITRVEGSCEGEALVTTEKLSHLANAVGNDGIIRMHGHPLLGQSYAGKIMVYSTDIFSTGGAWALYYKVKIAGSGPKALICRKVHPISIGGAVDAEIPAVDNFDDDPCEVIHNGDWVKITAPQCGREAIVEVFPSKDSSLTQKVPLTHLSDTRSIQSNLVLNVHETEMLNGKFGKAKQLAMERLVKFAQGLGSKKMVPVVSAHVFCDWKTTDLTSGAWPMYEEFAKMDARVAVPTTMESTFMADDMVDDEDMPWHFKVKTPAREVYEKTKFVNDKLQSMGIYVIPTCIPYMHLNTPRFGEFHATSESNHAAYSNIMVGARVNRDPANMAFYAAITGVMPEYGVHMAENRRGQMIFEIDKNLLPELKDTSDFVALGGAIGFRAVDRVPVVVGLDHLTNEQAKAFCACVSPALTYPMIHIVGITPEARTLEEAFGGSVPSSVPKIHIGITEVQQVYHQLRFTDNPNIDAAIIGCPFLSIQELDDLSDMLDGKKVMKMLWLHTDYVIYNAAKKAGILAKIERSGARVVHSVCPGMVDRDRTEASKLIIATDSLKIAMLMSGIGWPKYWFGVREDIVNSAITGNFRRTRWS